ncbi:C-GCAxxG-C-C family protein [Clostridiaceae bacterium M8S5]|nr:C-GCAxxG-C-C family protein [Clostridiaceae bacterium M8S5]
MLKELIKSGYGIDEGYSCAQKILYGANEVYNLGLDDKSLALSAGFGGGMARESVCGALTAAIMVISSLYKDKYEKKEFRMIVSGYLNRYEKEMSSIECKDLKESIYYNETDKCNYIIYKAALMLDEIVTIEENKH